MIDIYEIKSKNPPLLEKYSNDGLKCLSFLGKVMNPEDFQYFLDESNNGGNRQFQTALDKPNNRNNNNEPFRSIGNYVGTGPNMDHHCFSYFPLINGKVLSPTFTVTPEPMDKVQSNPSVDQCFLGLIVDFHDNNLKYFESGKTDVWSDNNNLGIHNKVCNHGERAGTLKVNNDNATLNGAPINNLHDSPLTTVGKQYLEQILDCVKYSSESITNNTNNVRPLKFTNHNEGSLSSNLEISEFNNNDIAYKTISSLNNVNIPKSRKVVNTDIPINCIEKNRFAIIRYDLPDGAKKVIVAPYSEICVRSCVDPHNNPINFVGLDNNNNPTKVVKNPIKINTIFIDFRKEIALTTDMKKLESNLITLKKNHPDINLGYISEDREYHRVTLKELLNEFHNIYPARAFNLAEINNIKTHNFNVREVWNGNGNNVDQVPAQVPAQVQAQVPHVPHLPNLVNGPHGPHAPHGPWANLINNIGGLNFNNGLHAHHGPHGPHAPHGPHGLHLPNLVNGPHGPHVPHPWVNLINNIGGLNFNNINNIS